MITLKRFRRLEHAVREAGFEHIIEWSENVAEPQTADEFAAEAIYVICNSGMRQIVASQIHKRCMFALQQGRSATTEFGHPGKAPAIDQIWAKRETLFAGFNAAADKIAFCEALPWIGPVTSHHLARNCGSDTAKPDVHLERLARAERKTTLQMCRRLAKQTGYRLGTVDAILWRAAAEGILNSSAYEQHGWRVAFKGAHAPASTGKADAKSSE